MTLMIMMTMFTKMMTMMMTADRPGRCWKETSWRQDKRPDWKKVLIIMIMIIILTIMLQEIGIVIILRSNNDLNNLEHWEKEIVSEGSNRCKLRRKEYHRQHRHRFQHHDHYHYTIFVQNPLLPLILFFVVIIAILSIIRVSAPVSWRSWGWWAGSAGLTQLFWKLSF